MPRLFGREAELHLISAALDGLPGQGRCLGIVGEAGIGKSALLAGACDEARRRGLPVLSAAGSEDEARLGPGLLRRLLGPVLHLAAQLPPRHREALLEVLRPSPDAGRGGLGAGRGSFFTSLAVLELIAAAGSRSPVVMIVDDLQWADDGSRDVIGFVARRVEPVPVVLLMATRPVTHDPLTDTPAPECVRLGGLAPAAAADLLGATSPYLAAADRRRVLAIAAGNPLALLELPLGLGFVPRPAAPSVAETIPLTARLERVITDQVTGLDPVARSVLLAAALQDRGNVAEMISAIVELSGGSGGSGGFGGSGADSVTGAGTAAGPVTRQAASAALDAVTSAGLLAISGGAFRFRSPLLRTAIAQAAPAGRLAAVHEALARVLTADPDRAAWHRAMAASRPDEELASALDAGADRAAALAAPDRAEELLVRAAELSADQPQRGTRLLRAAELAFSLGRRESADEMMAQALGLRLDAAGRARLAAVRGLADSGAPAASGMLVRAARDAQASDESLAARLLLAAATSCYRSGAAEPAREQVRATARSLGLPRTDPHALLIGALLDPFGSSAIVAAGLAQSRRRAGGGPGAADRRRAGPAGADPGRAVLLARAALVAGDFDSALEMAEVACAGLRRRGLVAPLTQAVVVRAFSALYLGRWGIAEAAGNEARHLAERTGQPAWMAFATVGQGCVAGLRGDEERATRLAAEAGRVAEETGSRSLGNAVQFARGLTALSLGRPGEAFAHLRRMMTPQDPAYHSPQSVWACGYLAEAAACSGHAGEARAMLGHLGQLAAGTTAPAIVRELALSRAVLAGADDSDWAASGPGGARGLAGSRPLVPAQELIPPCELTRATELAGGAPQWYQARLALAHGSWLRRAGRASEAVQRLHAARSAFEAMDVTAWAARASAELAATSRGRCYRSRPGARLGGIPS